MRAWPMDSDNGITFKTLGQSFGQCGERAWVLHRQREILRERFVDNNPPVLSASQSGSERLT